MIGVLDLFVVTTLENKIKELIANPDRIEFLLCGFHANQQMLDYIGAPYVKQAVEYILNNKINIFPYYNLDMQKHPSVAVVCSGNEHQKFIGDYGQNETYQAVRPTVVAKFDAKSISGDSMTVPTELNLKDKLWIGLVVTNGVTSNIISGIDESTIYFKEPFPLETRLTNWQAQTLGSYKMYEVGASIDNVTIQIKITTMGDPSLHRIVQLILRGVIKSARLDFDNIGLQDISISYGSLALTNQDDSIFESVISIDGKFTDRWVIREFDTFDPASKINIRLCADSDTEGTEEVEFS